MKFRVRLGLIGVAAGLLTFFTVAVAQQLTFDPPKSFSGKVVSVADGDTITVLRNNQKYRIRLEGIDAPESFQDFGTTSKKALADKVLDKEVAVKWHGRDRYMRLIGEVYLGERRMALEMVREGMAWHYLQYDTTDSAFASAEKEAKIAKRGLWSAANPIPPWNFRKLRHDEIVPPGDSGKIRVYVTEKGEKYHRDGCHALAKSKISKKLEEVATEYEPCSVCQPPVIGASTEMTEWTEPKMEQPEAVPPSGDSSCLPLTIGTGVFFAGILLTSVIRP